MQSSYQTFKDFLLAAFVATCLIAVPACGSTVRVGRAAPPPEVQKIPGDVQKIPARVEEKKPPVKAEVKKPDTPAAVPSVPPAPKEEPKRMAEAAPAPAKKDDAASAPKSSPARPKADSGEKPKGGEAPYALDLSFGGFGLGVGLLDTPVGVAVDDQENIYVVDQGNFRIQRFDRFGIFQFAFGRQGMGDGEFVEEGTGVPLTPTLRMTGEFEFNKPVGILLDKDQTRNLTRLMVVDSLNYRVRTFLVTSNPLDRFPDDVFVMLVKMVGNMPDTALRDKYAAENRQVILDPIFLNEPSGKANKILLSPFVWGGLGFAEGMFNMPTYLTMDDAGILYVADTGNSRVQGFRITQNDPANFATFFREWGNDLDLSYGAGRLNEPTAVAFDSSGFGGFLVLDKTKDGKYMIERFDKEGKFLNVFATSGDKEGQFRQPVCMAVNPFDNTVYVTDKARKKVMVYNAKGEFVFEFGGEELADPRGITVLRNNFVYVTDAVKNMVYRYVPR